jgi:hypothetical protein
MGGRRLEDARMAGFMSAVAIAAAAAIMLPGSACAEDCLADWGRAGQIVRRENLITVDEVSKSLEADGIGRLVKTTLCWSDGAYFYRLVVLSPTGQLKTTVMMAKVR